MIDQGVFRQAMGRFATGVTVVTTRHQDRNHGMTLSAMTSLCVEPPMLLICVNKAVPTEQAISASDRFVVNVLADYQERLARRFAKPAADKFEGVDTVPGLLDVPIIAGALAYFECKVRDRMTGGTHTIFIGEVEDAQVFERRPLLYYSAGFGRLESSAPGQEGLPSWMIPELAEESPVPSGVGAPVRLGLHFWS